MGGCSGRASYLVSEYFGRGLGGPAHSSFTHPPPIENYCSSLRGVDSGGWERLPCALESQEVVGMSLL